MNTNSPTNLRPGLDTLACVNERCMLYGQKGQDNLTVRKTYGKEGIRYLRCRCCGGEFSERKQTALWNTRVTEDKAIAVADHLAEGCSLKATARLAKVHPSVVRRLNEKVGRHAEAFHDERVHDLDVIALEADERHGYAQNKSQPQWEAEVIDSPYAEPHPRLLSASSEGSHPWSSCCPVPPLRIRRGGQGVRSNPSVRKVSY